LLKKLPKNNNFLEKSLLQRIFIPFLTGSKTPLKIRVYKEDKREITARKDPTKDRMSKDQARHKDVAFYA
jgi:hypothetical protein